MSLVQDFTYFDTPEFLSQSRNPTCALVLLQWIHQLPIDDLRSLVTDIILRFRITSFELAATIAWMTIRVSVGDGQTMPARGRHVHFTEGEMWC